MFISIFNMNKVFFTIFFFFTRVIYEVLYYSIMLGIHWLTSAKEKEEFFKETGTNQFL
jgi:hypothetical protein